MPGQKIQSFKPGAPSPFSRISHSVNRVLFKDGIIEDLGVYQGEARIGARVPHRSLGHSVFQFRYYRGHHFSHITNNSVIGYLENFSIGIFVDGNDHF